MERSGRCIKNMSVMFIVLLLFLTCIYARRFAEEEYPGNYYDPNQYVKINAALQMLEHAPQFVPKWPMSAVDLGQVSGVALDLSGIIYVFHRASNAWDINTFTETNVYRRIGDNPIPQHTILMFNETGELVDSWGQDLFYMPHGITIDNKGNVWVTDVALHQVFKFTRENRTHPALTLGEKFVPRDDDTHFCKPSAVAVMSTGDFFVADGYCNSRIIKFAPDGTRILQWGKYSGRGEYVLNVPHALALAEERGELCVADREHGRVGCFRAASGQFTASFSHWLVGPRLFSVAYTPTSGGQLFIVNGPTNGAIPVRGYVIDYTTGKLIKTFAPKNGFSNPHDIAVSGDGRRIYVAELDPHRVWAFQEPATPYSSVLPHAKPQPSVQPHAKPTATSEASQSTHEWGTWEWGAWAGAATALAAAAALLVALCSARSRGKHDYGDPLLSE